MPHFCVTVKPAGASMSLDSVDQTAISYSRELYFADATCDLHTNLFELVIVLEPCNGSNRLCLEFERFGDCMKCPARRHHPASGKPIWVVALRVGSRHGRSRGWLRDINRLRWNALGLAPGKRNDPNPRLGKAEVLRFSSRKVKAQELVSSQIPALLNPKTKGVS